MLDAYLNRCNNGSEYDNNQVIKNLISLRLQKANILGYEDYAAYVLKVDGETLMPYILFSTNADSTCGSKPSLQI